MRDARHRLGALPRGTLERPAERLLRVVADPPRDRCDGELTCQLATLEPPPPARQRLLAAAAGNQAAMDGFARVMAGVTSPTEFFSDQNVGRIQAQAVRG